MNNYRQMKNIDFKKVVAVIVILCLLSFIPNVVAQTSRNNKFEFALIGDMPYNANEEKQFSNLIKDINRSQVKFTVHDGDFKSGSSPCTDEVFQTHKNLFQQFKQPFIFIFGDNEWTDCHRPGAGAYNTIERLTKLRQIFTQGNQSLGQRTLTLTRQGDTSPKYSKFRENVFWTYKNISFIGLHIIGSNNNLGRDAENDAEYVERNAANIDWLKQGFIQAKRNKSRGIVIVMQANPNFEQPIEKRTGFNDFINGLQTELANYSQQTILVHGDSHYFRIDKPLNNPKGTSITNFTRIETFGTPNIHWLRVTVNPSNPNLFEINQQIVY